MKLIERLKLKPTKGDVYIKGSALPESDYETATGRQLYTITAIRKAYDAGYADGSSETGVFNVCIDGEHIPDDVVKKAVFLYMTGGWVTA